jgi:hypothetical protein
VRVAAAGCRGVGGAAASSGQPVTQAGDGPGLCTLMRRSFSALNMAPYVEPSSGARSTSDVLTRSPRSLSSTLLKEAT